MRAKTSLNSLATRTSLFLLLVIISAQILAGLIWYQHASERDKTGLLTTVRSLALSASSTISFFSTLPSEYRHLVLNQLRNMGGTRFFVSLNNHPIYVKPLPESQRKTLVVDEVKSVLAAELQNTPTVLVEFTRRDDLRVFNNELPIDELPMLWAHYSLSLGDLNPPILVMQIEVAENEWFYLAAVLPAPYIHLETSYFDLREWFTLLLSGLLLLICTWFVVRREIRPIRQLAKAATLMSSRLKVPRVKEEGSTELRAAIRAFNKMNQRIDSHIKDREMLFGAISHDLKTPIACLKLRADMLDNDEERERFSKIANDLDLMVKGALQCIKETDIHEEIESVDLTKLIEHITSGLDPYGNKISMHCSGETCISGKPLALKRALQNLIDNALKYGQQAHITLSSQEDHICIEVQDNGTSLRPEQLDKLCEPYYRGNASIEGNGLGLTISNSIIKAHGGHLSLSLTELGGLNATLLFPRETL
ncbi:ATP-binding protein [Vibrio vulnificus]|uniref:ATP-binding protein n=1 Tax=Vibrio vulnificus TaxID=672 RepID=UPI0001F5B161|nr:ATP-binding protein [Vibrio vulnificus]ADV89354.1 integral membrane sensor signal transduction histidine kinase, glucose catabolism cluster [Vibrio vulnificus MO6-24/O]EGR0039762.1 HAMP domain-containing protein [Vibrio vulnificus]EGR0092097.1 HAMP domain-containing protein [Vibrio vulnificus]EGR0096854.1 HAMP domain-containing protein [Vibrio vulnificus]EGR1422767.1 HAMP domain-containing protein [Vibrio vulnificus]